MLLCAQAKRHSGMGEEIESPSVQDALRIQATKITTSTGFCNTYN